ncbi:hypothetical protein GCM10023107_19970 [Actinoplanes octamycinicus]
MALSRSGRPAEALEVIAEAAAELTPDADWLVVASTHRTRAVLLAHVGSRDAEATLAYGDSLAAALWRQRLNTLHAARTRYDLEQLRARHEQVARAAEVDPLTGIANRRGFDSAVQSAACRTGPVAVLLVDTDKFKVINDTRGHAAGDAALQAIAAALAGQAGPGDLVARLGGDEFAALLAGADAAEAAAVAARMVAAVRDIPECIATVSIGVAVGPAAALNESLCRADAAMYRAKRRGGDGVETADEPVYGPPPEPACSLAACLISPVARSLVPARCLPAQPPCSQGARSARLLAAPSACSQLPVFARSSPRLLTAPAPARSLPARSARACSQHRPLAHGPPSQGACPGQCCGIGNDSAGALWTTPWCGQRIAAEDLPDPRGEAGPGRGVGRAEGMGGRRGAGRGMGGGEGGLWGWAGGEGGPGRGVGRPARGRPWGWAAGGGGLWGWAGGEGGPGRGDGQPATAGRAAGMGARQGRARPRGRATATIDRQWRWPRGEVGPGCVAGRAARVSRAAAIGARPGMSRPAVMTARPR